MMLMMLRTESSADSVKRTSTVVRHVYAVLDALMRSGIRLTNRCDPCPRHLVTCDASRHLVALEPDAPDTSGLG